MFSIVEFSLPLVIAVCDYSDEKILHRVSLCCLNNTTISHDVYYYYIFIMQKNSVKYL